MLALRGGLQWWIAKMLEGSAESIERKIKRLNAIRAEYESDLTALKKRLREDAITREKFERLSAITQSKVDRILAQVKKLRMKKDRLS